RRRELGMDRDHRGLRGRQPPPDPRPRRPRDRAPAVVPRHHGLLAALRLRGRAALRAAPRRPRHARPRRDPMTTPPPPAAAEPCGPPDPRGEMLRRLAALRGASSWDAVPAAARDASEAPYGPAERLDLRIEDREARGPNGIVPLR